MKLDDERQAESPTPARWVRSVDGLRQAAPPIPARELLTGDPRRAPRSGPARRSSGGFTLIEVLVSMVVLSIGLVGSVAALGQSIRWNSQARKVTAAQLLGNEILERLRLEARFDGENASGGAANSGLSKGGALDVGNAWASDRLPYLSTDRVEAPPGASLSTCNPAGAADGTDYGVGPFALRYEGNVYWVCYGIVAPAAGFPAGSIGALVKVIWSGDQGTAASHVSGLLVSGF